MTEWLARRFEDHRPHLRRVAYRMLGSFDDAEDAVQEAWLRLSRNESSGIANLWGLADDRSRPDLPGYAAFTAPKARGFP